MHRTAPALTTTALVMLLAAAPAAAVHCVGDVTTIELDSETLNVETRDNGQPGGERYVYLESNDEPGLQQGGDVVGCDKPCTVGELLSEDRCGHANPDTLLVGYDGTDT